MKNRLAWVSFSIICVYIVLAVLISVGWIYPRAGVVDYDIAYRQPSFEHWFGTDIFGRDVFEKAVHGIKTAMSIGLVSSLISVPIGVIFGASAGYFGGWIDEVITWIYSTVDSIPSILLVIALAYALGPGITNTYIAIGSTSWISLCRILRGEFMKLKEREFVLAASAIGASHWQRIWKHILPNTIPIILIQFSLQFVYAIKSEVILSYLGLGVTSGQFSWGIMIDDSKQRLSQGVWWELACATLFMFVIVLSFNLFNDGLAEALDPRRRRNR